MQFAKEIEFGELHQRSKIINYCLLLFWLVKHEHFLKFIWRIWIFSSLILEIKDILCGKEPLPQSNEVYHYDSSYLEGYLTVSRLKPRLLTSSWDLRSVKLIDSWEMADLSPVVSFVSRERGTWGVMGRRNARLISDKRDDWGRVAEILTR